MREVRMEKWCDFCWLDGEQRVPSEHSFAIGIVESLTRGPIPKLLEACEVHSKPVRDLMEVTMKMIPFTPEKPAPVAKPKPAATANPAPSGTLFDRPAAGAPSLRPHDCPVCHLTASTKQALVSHVWAQHTAETRPDAPTVCPDCGEGPDKPQSIAQHRRSAHSYDALEDALARVSGPYPGP